MTNYTLTISTLEAMCGVTLEAVAEVLPLVLLIDNGNAVMVPPNIGPALASTVARAAMGKQATISHMVNGYPVYVPAYIWND